MPHDESNAKGIKKSKFSVDDSKFASGFMDFFVGGANFKISVTNLIAKLGATGILQQSGDVLAVPVLDTQGATQNIRNIETEPGITAEVSPQNGVLLKNAIIQGSGISIVDVGQTKVIQAVATPTSSKTIIVQDINDFPAAVAGVITLQADREYLLINDISTTNRFVFSNSSVIKSGSAVTITLTYTGTGDMFTSSVINSAITTIGLACPNGNLVNLTSSGNFTLLNLRVLSANTLATVANFGSLFIGLCVIRNIATTGIVFSGTNVVFDTKDTLYSIASGTLFDLGVSTFDVWMSTDCILESTGAVTILSGAVSSANINTGHVGTFTNNRMIGVGPITSLSGITPDDARWEFQQNDLIQDTVRSSLVTISGNSTATTITGGSGDLGNPIKVSGTWIVQKQSGFTADTTAKITRDGKDLDSGIICTIAAIKTGGGNTDYKFYLAKNGTVIAASGITISLSTAIANTTLIFENVISDTEFFELFVEAQSGTDDMTLMDSQFSVFS